MNYNEIATLWLTRSNYSMWSELEDELANNPQRSHRLTLDPKAIVDRRAEVLLAGEVTLYGKMVQEPCIQTGLRPYDFNDKKLAAIVFGESRGSLSTYCMDQYCDASDQVDILFTSHLAGVPEELISPEARRFTREACEAGPVDVALALALRIKRLSEARTKLGEVYRLLNPPTHITRSGVSV